MAIVAGVDFGTLSVRVTLMDSDNGCVIAGASAGYELTRSAAAPLMGAQSHDDHMTGLASAMHEALQKAGIPGSDVRALAIDTTGSSVVMVDDKLRPLADYYLWCDHQAHEEAREITRLGQAEELESLRWCGGTYSHEWGFAKVLHFLRHNPEKRAQFYTALEHCDMVAATLCGITERNELPRSLCGAGHKWMYGSRWGGFPPQAFFSRVDPLFDGILDKMAGRYLASDAIAGYLSEEWADKLGLAAGIPIPVGALDAHWDAIGSGGQPGDVVNVIGTSTCIISMGPADFNPVEGLCGVAADSVVPGYAGIEAGQSATGDVFSAIAKRASSDVATLAQGIEDFAPCQTGLLRLNWDNGDRTVLVRSDLSGVMLGWDLNHEARDELHAAIEGMALHVRIIIDRMCEGGLQPNRIVNAGGIPQKNDILNQIYADVLNKEVYVPSVSPVGTGSCIFAAVAAGLYPDIQAAQKAMAPSVRVFSPRPTHVAGYEKLFVLYREAYFGFGEGRAVNLPGLLARLKEFRTHQGIH